MLKKLNQPKIDKVLVDLGVSSWQIDQPERGFSFQKDGPLDMRMNASEGQTASDILQHYETEALLAMFKTGGELRRPEKLVQRLIEKRKSEPISTTLQLVEHIKKSFYFRNQRTLFMKTCAQVFQALRMEVNQELQNLGIFLEALESHLNPSGRVAIITFHSLEDRLVKQFFKSNSHFQPINKKVISPTYAQTQHNPRSRSAKLRVYSYCPQ